ncbi:uncharacterized protein LOC125026277 [Penaeus chinensis]|uniref:uncharacterized protein LOC125026277 n=1 Tax=Penaeus chinensis TaxID=139456 RepID=UPI001FB7ACCB|nr:uncharacterized protein LOC125026277 [Penaeus chinensis]
MVLQRIGCPPILRQLIFSFHEDMKGTVQFDDRTSDSFDIRGGVKQGCILAPTLFGIFFAMLLEYAFRTSPGDVFLHWRTDGSLFNITRLKAKTKISSSLLRDLLFADDAALVAHNGNTLQIMMNHLTHACQAFSLIISVKKTATLTQTGTPTATITLDNSPLQTVEKFCYLGSTITTSTSLDEELNARIGKAGTSFGKLNKRAWNNKMLTLRTKIKIYEACVLSSLPYGAETWTLYSSQEKRLNTYHLRCLRKIMGISWEDRKTNSEVLELAGLPSMFTILGKRRLRWLGHLRRMDDSRIPKQLLYGEMAQGTRPRGRPKLRFKDKCKSTLTKFNINPSKFEDTADGRTAWKSTLTAGAKHNENNIISAAAQKRQARKENPPVPCGALTEEYFFYKNDCRGKRNGPQNEKLENHFN